MSAVKARSFERVRDRNYEIPIFYKAFSALMLERARERRQSGCCVSLRRNRRKGTLMTWNALSAQHIYSDRIRERARSTAGMINDS